MALVIQGKCLGLKSVPNKDPAKGPRITGGISFPKPNGFAGEETVLTIQFFPKQIEQGLHNAFQALQGKTVEMPVSVNARNYNGDVYVDYNCEGVLIDLSARPKLEKVSNA